MNHDKFKNTICIGSHSTIEIYLPGISAEGQIICKGEYKLLETPVKIYNIQDGWIDIKEIHIQKNWISVKDKLPKEFEEVLFFYQLGDSENSGRRACGHLCNEEWHLTTLFDCLILNSNVKVKFWMPLPYNPKESD